MNRAWLVWGAAVVAYAVAVLQRTTLGVAGLEAAEHFSVSPGVLSSFVVVQLVVYAGMQVPAGVLLDRFGSRALLTVGMLLMASGQFLMAWTDQLPLGFVARIIVGAGDAFIFGSALRLVPVWFKPSSVPILTQLTGMIGASGQLLSATGFLALLHLRGWTTAFAVAAGLALAAGALTLGLVRNRPASAELPRPPVPLAQVHHEIAAAWTHPGTRLGLWTHMTTGFAPMVFAMMWGMPYLVRGEGLSAQAASGYYSLLVVSTLVMGPLIGVLTARHPLRRSNLVFLVTACNAIPWLVIFLWPGAAPAAVLVALMIGLATGGPGSGIGFDYARTSVPIHRLGTANGIVIVGSFTAAVLDIAVVGLVLDWLRPSGEYTLTDMRIALATQIPFWVFGLVAVVISRTKLRRMMATRGVIVPPWKDALRRRYRR